MKHQPTHRCPHCGSTTIDRVRPHRVLDRVAKLVVGWRVYRCGECGDRFYDKPTQRKAS